jgi:CO/xanthine dehydrogenase Mo-binding subunit
MNPPEIKEKIGPFSPEEMISKKYNGTPQEVYEVFNNLIIKNWNGYSATISQNMAVNEIAEKLKMDTSEIFNNNWMNIEEAYRNKGWRVDYNKPGYNEAYEATFYFRKKE